MLLLLPQCRKTRYSVISSNYSNFYMKLGLEKMILK